MNWSQVHYVYFRLIFSACQEVLVVSWNDNVQLSATRGQGASDILVFYLKFHLMPYIYMSDDRIESGTILNFQLAAAANKL